jgi:hypothetical protein
MAIYRLLQDTGFAPERIKMMTSVYEDVLKELHLVDREDPITDMVARAVFDVTAWGEVDPIRLRDEVLKQLSEKKESSDQ